MQTLNSSDKVDSVHTDISLPTLVTKLRDYLGDSSGLKSKDVSVDHLKSLLDSYEPVPGEWEAFGRADPSRAYTRLLVDAINGRSNLLFLVWNPRKGSPVHDHAASECIMKIVRGSLSETIYEPPQPGTEKSLRIQKKTLYREGDVAHISDQIGLHEVYNQSQEDMAVSLHLYTPPNAAEYGYNIYDRDTGHRSHIPGAKYQI